MIIPGQHYVTISFVFFFRQSIPMTLTIHHGMTMHFFSRANAHTTRLNLRTSSSNVSNSIYKKGEILVCNSTYWYCHWLGKFGISRCMWNCCNDLYVQVIFTLYYCCETDLKIWVKNRSAIVQVITSSLNGCNVY